MKEKNKIQKGFIPIILAIVIAVAIISATVGIVKYKDEITANVSKVFESKVETFNVASIEKNKVIKELELTKEPIVEEGVEAEEKQDDTQQLQEQLRIAEQKRLEAEKQLAEEKAKQETEKAKTKIEEVKRKAKAEEDARIKAEQELQRELEIQRLAEEQKRQQKAEEVKRLLGVQKEAQKLTEEQNRQKAEEQNRQKAEEKERQLQAEYSYYIERLTSIKNDLLDEKETIPLAINQIDILFNQDINKALLDYQNALSKAERDFNLRIGQIGEYYAARGLTFSSARNAAVAEVKEDHARYTQLLENACDQSLIDIENYYNQEEQELKQLLNTINYKIQDIDYLISKLQQKILSEVDKLLLNKVLNY